MEAAYAFITHFFDFLLSRKRLFFILGGLLVFLILSAIAILILQKFPNSADEYVYLYQARTFLSGKLWNPAHALQIFFEFYWILNENGRVFGQYLPGWPLLLAAGMFLKIPSYLVGSLLGTLSLGALFLLGKKVYNERIALLAVALTFLSSFFIFNSASYFSHTPCSLLLILFVYFSLSFKDTSKVRNGLLSGFLFAAAFTTRPPSALLCGFPVFLYLLPDFLKAPKKILSPLAGALPVFILLFVYGFELTGNFFLLPPMLLKDNWNWGVTLTQVDRLTHYLKELFEWMPGSFPVLYVLYLLAGLAKRSRFSGRELLVGGFFIIFIAGYFFTIPRRETATARGTITRPFLSWCSLSPRSFLKRPLFHKKIFWANCCLLLS